MLDVAQQEMEKIRNLDYSQIALTSAPSSSASSLDPDSRVNGGQFALNRDGSNPAPMVINGGSLYGGGFVTGVQERSTSLVLTGIPVKSGRSGAWAAPAGGASAASARQDGEPPVSNPIILSTATTPRNVVPIFMDTPPSGDACAGRQWVRRIGWMLGWMLRAIASNERRGCR